MQFFPVCRPVSNLAVTLGKKDNICNEPRTRCLQSVLVKIIKWLPTTYGLIFKLFHRGHKAFPDLAPTYLSKSKLISHVASAFYDFIMKSARTCQVLSCLCLPMLFHVHVNSSLLSPPLTFIIQQMPNRSGYSSLKPSPRLPRLFPYGPLPLFIDSYVQQL